MTTTWSRDEILKIINFNCGGDDNNYTGSAKHILPSVHTAVIIRKAVPAKALLLHENVGSSSIPASYDSFGPFCAS